AAHCKLILFGAADPPLGGHDRAVLTHRKTGTRLGVTGYLGHDLSWTNPCEQLHPPAGRGRAIEVEQDLAQFLVERERSGGGGVVPRGAPGVDLAQCALLGHRDRRLETGPARLLDVIRGRLWCEACAEHGFAGEVAVAGMLEDRAGNDLAEALALEVEAIDQ